MIEYKIYLDNKSGWICDAYKCKRTICSSRGNSPEEALSKNIQSDIHKALSFAR